MARWIPLDTGFQDDDRIASIRREFGNAGVGVLAMLWAHIGRYGARPGAAVRSSGEPFELENLARRFRVSRPYLQKFVANCARSGLIDRQSWEAKGLIVFPHLARKLKAYADSRSDAERQQAHRDRGFDRVAAKHDNRCVRCGSGEDLELERIVPKDEGGSNAEDNLQIACLPCARKRREERRLAKVRQNVTQDVTGSHGRNDLIRSDLYSTDRGSVESTDPVQTVPARARVANPEPGALPLIGPVPFRPRGLNPAQNPSSAPRDHLKCLAPCGVICYPGKLAEEHARALNMPDEEAAIAYVCAFRDRVLAAIPPGQVIGDRPYDFWRAHWAAAHPRAAPAIASGGSNGRPGPSQAAGRVTAAASKYDKLTRRDQDATRKNSR